MWYNDKMRLTEIENRVIKTFKYDDYIFEIETDESHGETYYQAFIHSEGCGVKSHVMGVKELDFLIEYLSGELFRLIADYREEMLIDETAREEYYENHDE